MTQMINFASHSLHASHGTHDSRASYVIIMSSMITQNSYMVTSITHYGSNCKETEK